MKKIINIYSNATYIAEIYFYPLVALAARIIFGFVFWYAGYTKILTWDQTLFLFEHDYAMPLIPFVFAAYSAVFLELVGSVALALGLGTRVFSLMFFVMTCVIEIFIYPGTQEHYYWLIILAMLIVKGPGRLSFDDYIRKTCMRITN